MTTIALLIVVSDTACSQCGIADEEVRVFAALPCLKTSRWRCDRGPACGVTNQVNFINYPMLTIRFVGHYDGWGAEGYGRRYPAQNMVNRGAPALLLLFETDLPKTRIYFFDNVYQKFRIIP